MEGGGQTGQSWEWGETEHSVCCVYEGRTWHNTSRPVRVSYATPCSMAASSILSLSSQGAQ